MKKTVLSLALGALSLGLSAPVAAQDIEIGKVEGEVALEPAEAGGAMDEAAVLEMMSTLFQAEPLTPEQEANMSKKEILAHKKKVLLAKKNKRLLEAGLGQDGATALAAAAGGPAAYSAQDAEHKREKRRMLEEKKRLLAIQADFRRHLAWQKQRKQTLQRNHERLFNERTWLDGKSAEAALIELAFARDLPRELFALVELRRHGADLLGGEVVGNLLDHAAGFGEFEHGGSLLVDGRGRCLRVQMKRPIR